jgi:alkanesulfonate monooxygenase SsuD/methylene tetrahydromethanopterin reductase-like flavin-dependent oxidoreductase (luciferase family)
VRRRPAEREVKVGIYMDLRNPPGWRRPWKGFYGAALERVARAESLGISSVWLTEHHHFDDGYQPQPLTFAAAVAARTKRIRIGTAVLLAPLRPAIDIAEQAAVVDLLSDGRLDLGLGAGYVAAEFEAFGADIGRRFSLLESRVAEVRRLWQEGSASPLPRQDRVPIWLGVHGPRGGALAGRLGEGLLAFEPVVVDAYWKGLAEAGRDPNEARLSGAANMVISDDPEAAWPRLAPHVAHQWRTYREAGRPGARVGEVDAERLRAAGPEMAYPRFDVVTPAEAVSRLRAWLGDLPTDTVFFYDSVAGMPDDLVARHLELLAGEVAPALAHL